MYTISGNRREEKEEEEEAFVCFVLAVVCWRLSFSPGQQKVSLVIRLHDSFTAERMGDLLDNNRPIHSYAGGSKKNDII